MCVCVCVTTQMVDDFKQVLPKILWYPPPNGRGMFKRALLFSWNIVNLTKDFSSFISVYFLFLRKKNRMGFRSKTEKV